MAGRKIPPVFKRELIWLLRTRIAYLEGELETLRIAYEGMRQLASEALQIAQKGHPVAVSVDENSAATYVPPEVQKLSPPAGRSSTLTARLTCLNPTHWSRTMKTFALILLLCGGASAQMIKDGDSITNWTQFLKTQEMTFYYASIARDGDKVGVWFKFDIPKGSYAVGMTKDTDSVFWSARAYGIVQCSESRITNGTPQVLYYDENDRLILRRYEKDSIKSEVWAPIINAFCEQGLDKKPLTAPVLKPQVRSSSSPVDTAPKSDAASVSIEKTEHPARKP